MNFDLIRINDQYAFVHQKATLPGNIYRMVLIMRELGVTYHEIERGLIELERTGSNIARYKAGKFKKVMN